MHPPVFSKDAGPYDRNVVRAYDAHLRDLDFRERLFFSAEFPRREQHDPKMWPVLPR